MPGWAEILIRSIVFLTILFLITKGLGKKQMSQLDTFQYITGIVIGGIVAIHVSDVTANVAYGILALAVWFFIPFAVEFMALKSKRFRNFVQGKGTVLIQNGKIMEDNMKKERFTTDELLEELRNNNVFKASDVEFAVLEPTGQVNVLPKKENQPITPKILGQKVSPEKEPQTVIMDGKALLEPLANASLNTNWLETELDKMNVSIENVFLGQVDSDGQLTVDLYDDQLTVPEPTEKPLLLATMKKCQADLELFALATESQESKQLYQQNSERMQQAIDKITPYLQ
ncbi:Uncharacterized membrane protein YcaP, DUF421 family [Lentibacillus halodurans]|uniref:Uncharacterized membrane protein YcaP, DUF421 family n=1 Tax=Lentibacillus halodurans TaxID=237679 RepID=A0A1I1AB25_9BACI|nr:DUF421 domain-containing protein [Lentibacillus halodurans]SFB35147.1 Uncharacterized membrane protein YcaP, DUF421 family [Lentibacillus halodurans]